MRVLINDTGAERERFEAVHLGDYYGGSDVGAICGVNPFRTPLQVWMEKTGKAKPVVESAQMFLGKVLEPIIVQLFEREVGYVTNLLKQTWQSEKTSWMIVSPDALIQDESWALGEIKTHKIYADQYWSNDKASDSAQCQLQWALGVSDGQYDHGYCIALIGGDADKFYHPRFDFDKDLFEQMAGQIEKFRELVRMDTPPSAVAKDTQRIKELLIGKDLAGHVNLTETHGEMADRYVQLHGEAKELKDKVDIYDEEMKAIKNELLLAAKGAAFATVGDHEVKFFKVNNKGSVTQPYSYFNVKIK